MTIKQLQRLFELPHLSEYSFSEMISDFGLYEKCIIDTRNIRIEPRSSDGELCFMVSKDVEAYHKLVGSMDSVALACPYCKEKRPFKPLQWSNPRMANVEVKKVGTKVHQNVFSNYGMFDNDKQEELVNQKEQQQNPYYQFGLNVLANYNSKAIGNYDKDQYYYDAAKKCCNGILSHGLELRRDFLCSLDEHHRLFSDFIISSAVSDADKPDELIAYENKCREALIKENIKPKPNESEKEALSAFKKAKCLLVLRKVGQAPSNADLQLFETEKYRKVLGSHYRDLTMALGLYSSGVGAGSFVYLRRILEYLTEKAHSAAKQKDEWDEAVYNRKYFNEKIEYLEKFGEVIIPAELSGIKTKLYGVLSKGVHNSTEEECLELFPYTKYAIEVVLDKTLAEEERKRKLKQITSKIGSAKI